MLQMQIEMQVPHKSVCIQAKYNATLEGLQAYYEGPMTTVFWSQQFFADVNTSLNAQLKYQTTNPYNNSDAATTLYVSLLYHLQHRAYALLNPHSHQGH